jgi:hypothetical protein
MFDGRVAKQRRRETADIHIAEEQIKSFDDQAFRRKGLKLSNVARAADRPVNR